MKRILAVLMSTAMVLSLAACSQETAKTPEEIYDEALVKSMSLDALDGDMEIAMDMDMGGMTLGMKMSADMQIKKISDTESEMAMVMNTSILGQEVVIEEYFKDGYLYMNDGAGTKVKAPFEYSEIAGQATMNTATSRDFMDKLEMTEDENGNYVFNYTIAQDKMNEYLSDALEGMDELVGDTGSYTIGEMTGTCVIDKDYNVLSDKVHMVMNMTAEGQEVAMSVDVSIVYNAVGDAVTVSFPDDLDSYTEVDTTCWLAHWLLLNRISFLENQRTLQKQCPLFFASKKTGSRFMGRPVLFSFIGGQDSGLFFRQAR